MDEPGQLLVLLGDAVGEELLRHVLDLVVSFDAKQSQKDHAEQPVGAKTSFHVVQADAGSRVRFDVSHMSIKEGAAERRDVVDATLVVFEEDTRTILILSRRSDGLVLDELKILRVALHDLSAPARFEIGDDELRALHFRSDNPPDSIDISFQQIARLLSA